MARLEPNRRLLMICLMGDNILTEPWNLVRMACCISLLGVCVMTVQVMIKKWPLCLRWIPRPGNVPFLQVGSAIPLVSIFTLPVVYAGVLTTEAMPKEMTGRRKN